MCIGILDNFVFISKTIYSKCHFPSFGTERDVNIHFTNTKVYHIFYCYIRSYWGSIGSILTQSLFVYFLSYIFNLGFICNLTNPSARIALFLKEVLDLLLIKYTK